LYFAGYHWKSGEAPLPVPVTTGLSVAVNALARARYLKLANPIGLATALVGVRPVPSQFTVIGLILFFFFLVFVVHSFLLLVISFVRMQLFILEEWHMNTIKHQKVLTKTQQHWRKF